MTILQRGKTHLISRLKFLTPLQRFNHTLTKEGLKSPVCHEMGRDLLAQQRYDVDRSKWRKVNARYHGITRSMIPDAPWTVLKVLRVGGFEAYLVGGCVRDLLLNRVPKDFDVITTANLQQIKKKFHRALIVGRRFPICIVHVKGSVIEVSSFETNAQQCQEKEKVLLSQMRRSCDEKDFLLWKNSMQRDFTINSLFFDPFMNRIYDYANGMEDVRSLKLQTLIPARLSFQEDCARILRGIRIAGRLGLSISKDTETAICKLQSSVKSLNKDRIKMELNYMLSYGAAESTILLLQRFHLLKIFLPFHAAYLHEQTDEVSAQGSTMLMKLLYSLDKMVSSDQPCDCSLWVGLLAFHQALVLNPQDAFVIWAFASILYCGTWQEGVKFARENAKVEGRFVPEISGFSEIKSDEKLAEEVSQLASLVQDAVNAFTDEISLSESLSRYLDPPFDAFVFVSKKIGEHAALLFHMQSCEYRRESFKIDYDLLVKGDLYETRFVLGKVILKTLSGGLVQGGKKIIKEELKSVKENHEPTLSDLAKDGRVVKKVKEHVLLSFDEQKIEKVKQKEKVKMKCSSEQNINSMKEKVVLKDASMEIAKKQRKVEEKFCSPLQESDKKEVVVGDEEHQHRAKKHRKMVEKVKHQELCCKETKEPFNVIRKCNPSEDEKIKGGEKNDRPPVLQEMVKEKSVQSCLSSLFR
ncbi:hypothetical protein NC652_012423 [Populus alba x Populus x berolinensis]|nr:hypothetical protein NC652_012423 [Populus alba x Populus x berolinensis]